MTPHDPVIPDDGRRCDFIQDSGQRCNLLAEEHDPLVYVAIIPTKYQIVAVGTTEDEARNAAADAWLARRGDFGHPDHTLLRDRQAVIDYFGANVYGPLVPGMAVSE